MAPTKKDPSSGAMERDSTSGDRVSSTTDAAVAVTASGPAPSLTTATTHRETSNASHLGLPVQVLPGATPARNSDHYLQTKNGGGGTAIQTFQNMDTLWQSKVRDDKTATQSNIGVSVISGGASDRLVHTFQNLDAMVHSKIASNSGGSSKLTTAAPSIVSVSSGASDRLLDTFQNLDTMVQSKIASQNTGSSGGTAARTPTEKERLANGGGTTIPSRSFQELDTLVQSKLSRNNGAVVLAPGASSRPAPPVSSKSLSDLEAKSDKTTLDRNSIGTSVASTIGTGLLETYQNLDALFLSNIRTKNASTEQPTTLGRGAAVVASISGSHRPVPAKSLSDLEEQVHHAKDRTEAPSAPVTVSRRQLPRELSNFQDAVLEQLAVAPRDDDDCNLLSAAVQATPQSDPLSDPSSSDLETGEASAGELAVAYTVDKDENAFLPAAIEYDPDAKPPIYRNRRFQFYSCFALVLALTGIVGAIVGIRMNAGHDATAYPPPLLDRATIGIREYVERLVGTTALDDPNDPYSKALNWIQFVDPMALSHEDKKFAQRFLAAYVHYSTSAIEEWYTDCKPSTEVVSNECVYMSVNSNDIFEVSPSPARRWLSSDDECSWGGVFCDALGQIRGFDFNGFSVTGAFPEGISVMPFLSFASFAHGKLKGTLPSLVGSMKHMSRLELTNNTFVGTIPDNLYSMRNVNHLNLGNNTITGTISSKIGQMNDIGKLVLYANELSGSIPSEIGLLPNLRYIFMGDNSLSGSFPVSLASGSPRLSYLGLNRNYLVGPIPSHIGTLSKLRALNLEENAFSGSLPLELSNLKIVVELLLQGNEFTGSINALAGLTSLTNLQIHNNRFIGAIPSALGLLKGLEFFTASGNDFVGSVPMEVCGLAETVTGQPGILDVLRLDCAGESAEIECTCCTECCNVDGTGCKRTST